MFIWKNKAGVEWELGLTKVEEKGDVLVFKVGELVEPLNLDMMTCGHSLKFFGQKLIEYSGTLKTLWIFTGVNYMYVCDIWYDTKYDKHC